MENELVDVLFSVPDGIRAGLIDLAAGVVGSGGLESAQRISVVLIFYVIFKGRQVIEG
jgi:hypothetical protein